MINYFILSLCRFFAFIFLWCFGRLEGVFEGLEEFEGVFVVLVCQQIDVKVYHNL